MNEQLFFISDKLLNPFIRKKMNIPLEFITFAIMEGVMYQQYRNTNTIVVRSSKQRWGNDVVYGAVFLLRDFHFYSRALDAYYLCSLSTLRKNHINDLNHRMVTSVTPITFHTIEELETLRYQEKETIKVSTYVGNTKHPKLTKRVHTPHTHYRLVDGVNKTAMQALLQEVLHGESNRRIY
jgi:hypothetical protein